MGYRKAKNTNLDKFIKCCQITVSIRGVPTGGLGGLAPPPPSGIYGPPGETLETIKYMTEGPGGPPRTVYKAGARL